jgi:multidrug efflux pump subunit AcrA (membrane-fusion protein)
VDELKDRPAPQRQIFSVIAGIILLLIVLLIAGAVVKKFKKPGQMGVIESQAMDMSVMQPPQGSFPVSTATALRKNFRMKTSTYGSVLAQNEIDIYPRVAGRIVEMSAYPGQQVSEGQVLARLDTAELASKANEAVWGARSHDEEHAMIIGKEKSAHFDKKAAQDEFSAAGSELRDAEADLAYWKEEHGRETGLFKEGAISKDEFQLTESKYRSAGARAETARSRQSAAQNRMSSLGYAELTAQAETKKHHATVAQAKAAADTANIILGYTALQAPFPAFVTARLVAPGTLVSVGAPILRLADMRKVRIQAVLAQKDIASIRKGNSLEYALPFAPDTWHSAPITAIFPAVDPRARTGIVEALVDNADFHLLPGVYLYVRVTTAAARSALLVPSRAVIQNRDYQNRPAVWLVKDEGKGEVSLYTCSMHPEVISSTQGKCPKCGMGLIPKKSTGGRHVYLTTVKLGLSDGTDTQITEGLREGDEIAVDGIEDLQNGNTVTPTAWGQGGPEKMPGPSGATSGDMPGMPAGSPMPSRSPEGTNTTKGRQYTCVMHPEVISDKPGTCPKCGMKLVPK